jgi:hypothetical protein
MKLKVWRKIYLRSGGVVVRTDAPAILARYTGTSGKTQGDKKDKIPAPKAPIKDMLIYCFSSIATNLPGGKRKTFTAI